MILTGKFKIDFESYLANKQWELGFTEPLDNRKGSTYLAIVLDKGVFYKLPFSMQQGVYLEFCRERGYHLEHQRSEIAENDIEYAFMILDGDTNLLAPVIKAPDYNTALTEALKKVNDLINTSNIP